MIIKLLVLASLATVALATVDQTLIEKTKNEDVVSAVIAKIHSSNIFHNDYDFLKRVAYVESKFGENPNTYRMSYFGGIWQVDKAHYVATTNLTQNPSLKAKHADIAANFQINWTANTTWDDLLKPLHSGLAARLYISTIEEEKQIPIPQTLQEQAKYWKMYFNQRNDVTEKNFTDAVNELGNQIQSCSGQMDVLVLLDSSVSVGWIHFQESLNTIATFFASLPSQDVRKGLIQFSSTTSVIFSLNNTLNDTEIQRLVKTTRFINSDTNTNEGILEAVKMFKESPVREGVPKLLIVFTDGQSPDEVPDIVKAQEDGIITYAVGIGAYINKEGLNHLAYGEMARVFSLINFEALNEFARRWGSGICSIPKKPEVNVPSRDLLLKNQHRNYEFNISDEGLTVLLMTGTGKTEGFYSYSFKAPNSAINDGVFGTRVFIPKPPMAIFAEVPKVFVTIKGLESSNNYTIEAQKGDVVSEVISSSSAIPEVPSSTELASTTQTLPSTTSSAKQTYSYLSLKYLFISTMLSFFSVK